MRKKVTLILTRDHEGKPEFGCGFVNDRGRGLTAANQGQYDYLVSQLDIEKEDGETVHLAKPYLVSYERLKVGDQCLFYGSLSEVLEEECNGTVKIKSWCRLSDDDMRFLKTDKREGWMTHGFAASQLPKIIVYPEEIDVQNQPRLLSDIMSNGRFCYVDVIRTDVGSYIEQERILCGKSGYGKTIYLTDNI